MERVTMLQLQVQMHIGVEAVPLDQLGFTVILPQNIFQNKLSPMTMPGNSINE
jgi:hypothetical protein